MDTLMAGATAIFRHIEQTPTLLQNPQVLEQGVFLYTRLPSLLQNPQVLEQGMCVHCRPPASLIPPTSSRTKDLELCDSIPYLIVKLVAFPSQAQHQANTDATGRLDSSNGQRETKIKVHSLQVCVWVCGGGYFSLPCLPLSARHPGPPHGLLPHPLQLTEVSGTCGSGPAVNRQESLITHLT